MPAKNRIGRDDGGDSLQSLSSQRPAPDGQTAALVVAESDALVAAGFLEYLNLGQKEIDEELLLTVEPAGQDDHEELPRLEDEVHAATDAGVKPCDRIEDLQWLSINPDGHLPSDFSGSWKQNLRLDRVCWPYAQRCRAAMPYPRRGSRLAKEEGDNAALLAGGRPATQILVSMQSRSLRRASCSIWRTRSRVRPMRWPICLRVMGSSLSSP